MQVNEQHACSHWKCILLCCATTQEHYLYQTSYLYSFSCVYHFHKLTILNLGTNDLTSCLQEKYARNTLYKVVYVLSEVY